MTRSIIDFVLENWREQAMTTITELGMKVSVRYVSCFWYTKIKIFKQFKLLGTAKTIIKFL